MNAPTLPGVAPEVGLTRAYPRGSDFAHVVGYVGPVSDFDLSQMEEPDQLLRIPRFQIGKVGIEARLEDTLRGEAGTRRVEVNAAGRVMRELDTMLRSVTEEEVATTIEILRKKKPGAPKVVVAPKPAAEATQAAAPA